MEQGLPSSGATKSFAADLLGRIPGRSGGAGGKGGGVSQQKKDEREATMAAERNRKYAMLEDDDEEEEPDAKAAKKASKEERKEERKDAKEEKRRQKQMRKAGGGGESDEEDEEAVVARKRAREMIAAGGGVARRRWEENENAAAVEDPAEMRARLIEEARDADLKDKEEFEDRLRARDDGKTKKVTGERQLTQEEKMEEERRGGAGATAEEQDALLPDLRKVSREEYLKKREAQKLDELKDMIEDEKFLFDGVEVSEAEKRDMAYRRKVYELATQQVRDIDAIMQARPYTTPLTQLNLSSCVPVTTQLIPLIHSEMLNSS